MSHIDVSYTVTRAHRVHEGQRLVEHSSGLTRFRDAQDFVDRVREINLEGGVVSVVRIEPVK